MSVFNSLTGFFENVFKKESKQDLKLKQITSEELGQMAMEKDPFEDRIEISKRTILSKLYSLEQIVDIIRIDYPEKYKEFNSKIELLRDDYIKTLEESKNPLTFQINPNNDSKKISEVAILERNIREFVEVDMKYDTIALTLQKFILRLNVLYNASIFYSDKKDSAMEQLKTGYLSEKAILNEFKDWSKILGRETEKERMYVLFSYTEYIMFKIYIRNARVCSLNEYHFNILDFIKTDSLLRNFKDYMLDELSDMEQMVSNIEDDIFRDSYINRIKKLSKNIISTEEVNNIVLNTVVWKEFQKLEDEILNTLVELKGKNKESVEIKVLDKLKITVKENDIFVTPKINAILNLSSIYYGVIKNDAIVITRFLQALSDDISYKDIYFLIVLFDMLDDVRKSCSSLYKKIEKYDLRYKYTQDEMIKKKKAVLNSNSKNYIYTFQIKEFEEKVFKKYLTQYNLDYYIKDNKVYMNSIYFNDLDNIKKDLGNEA